MKKFFVFEEIIENLYIFNPISRVKKGNFKGILYNYPEPGPETELEPEFG
jgi:hypothetical protein